MFVQERVLINSNQNESLSSGNIEHDSCHIDSVESMLFDFEGIFAARGTALMRQRWSKPLELEARET